MKAKRTHRDNNADVDDVLNALEQFIASSPDKPLDLDGHTVVSPTELFTASQIAGIPYRKGCGMASRKMLDQKDRRKVRSLLFRSRYILDSRIETTVQSMLESGVINLNRLLKRQVFGFCKKQGVSFRLSLSTCVPSPLCGGGCYAHDGRERVTSTILSGCYNTLIARNWEAGRVKDEMLVPHISRAVEFAKADKKFAESEYGFTRRARIRLAHVGELAAYPNFANWMGRTIQTISEGTVDGILYTRHPNIRELDATALVLNLTVDESSRNRQAWSHEGVRIVWSAWNGILDPTAKVNFLEHHDHGQHAEPVGEGSICPVTSASAEHRFCDAYHCTKCFDDPTQDPVESESIRKSKMVGTVRTRTQNMLGEVSQDSLT